MYNFPLRRLFFSAFLGGMTLCVNAQQIAFPEAQGWGRFAKGGRYGSVYHVTNLNDSGAGSLRDAVTTKNRIVVFDVAGVIQLKSRLVFASDLYVAGQTAPGEGITVYGNGVSFSGSNNIICRYMRFRMGVGGDSGKDCAGVANGTNMIFDHCSFAWGRDETFSINPDGKGDLGNITLQNCIVGQGLMSHSAGGLMQADNITLYGNFYCDNSTRNNKVKGKNQYVNNIVYNWKDGAYIMGGDSEGQSYCNIEGNLFVNGPCGTGNGFTGGNTNFHAYLKDNIQDSNRNGKYDPSAVTNFSGADIVATPYDYPTLPTISSNSLLEINIPTVGASLPYRDYVDCYMVDELNSFGTEGGFISNENSLLYGIPSSWSVWKGNTRVDSDKDGIPDSWETELGTNPNVNDAMAIASNGYTNIENYINRIGEKYVDRFLRAPLFVELVSSTTNTLTIKWRDWTRGEDGFVIEAKSADGSVLPSATTLSGVNTYTFKDLKPGTSYSIKIRAFAGTEFSEYSKDVSFKTLPEDVDIVQLNTYLPTATWTDAVKTWDLTSEGWQSESGKFSTNDRVLIENQGNTTLLLPSEVNPSVLVVNNLADLVIEGEGNIGGETSLNKFGNGTLTLNKTNTYTGATVLHDGILNFSSISNGGANSSIGKSQEFAQNWIFDGGTYNYTGNSASTNRNAKLLSESSLSVANSSSTLSLNGKFEGEGNLRLSGKGIVKIGTKNFFGYTGSTILDGAKVMLPTAEISNNGIGSSSKLVFAGGTLQTAGETEGYETYSFPIEIKDGTHSVFQPNRNCYIKSNISGYGTLRLNIPYVREYIQGKFDNFYGVLEGYGLSSGNLLLINNTNIPNGVVNLLNGIRLCGWDTTGNYTIGGLSGAAGTTLSGCSKKTDNFKCTWTIGGANTDETFRGNINNWSCGGSGHVGTVNIIKKGNGIWRITGTNDYKGTTQVSAGTLIVNGVNSGTGLVTVSKDATLAGLGSITGSVTVNTGGQVYGGDSTLVNKTTLTIKGKLTLQSGGVVTIPVSAKSDIIKVNKIALSGGLSVTNGILNLAFEEDENTIDLPLGTSIQVMAISGTATGSFSKVYPEIPGEGKVWDISKLVSKGVISVIPDPALDIKNAISDTQNDEEFDLNGRPAKTNSNGIIIKNRHKILK